MGCQRLGELTELRAGDGTMTTDALDQGGDGERALCWQAVFSHEPTQHRDQTSRAGVGRDTGEIRQYGSIGVPIERIQRANQEFPGSEQRVPRNIVQGGECTCR